MERENRNDAREATEAIEKDHKQMEVCNVHCAQYSLDPPIHLFQPLSLRPKL
jgi:hypothetical protein